MSSAVSRVRGFCVGRADSAGAAAVGAFRRLLTLLPLLLLLLPMPLLLPPPLLLTGADEDPVSIADIPSRTALLCRCPGTAQGGVLGRSLYCDGNGVRWENAGATRINPVAFATTVIATKAIMIVRAMVEPVLSGDLFGGGWRCGFVCGTQ